jgi:hypothetical protein
MKVEGRLMAHIPFWLRRLIKGCIQYFGVLVASIPAGLIYILSFRLTGNNGASLVIALSVGLVSAHLAWNVLDRRISLSSSPALQNANAVSGSLVSGNTYEFAGGARLVAAAGVVFYVMTCPSLPANRITLFPLGPVVPPVSKPLN